MKAAHYFHRGLATNTHRTYSSAQCQHLAFCKTHKLTAIPGDENTILLFITHLSQQISPQSIKVYLAGFVRYTLATATITPSPTQLNCNELYGASIENISLL